MINMNINETHGSLAVGMKSWNDYFHALWIAIQQWVDMIIVSWMVHYEKKMNSNVLNKATTMCIEDQNDVQKQIIPRQE